VSIEYEVRSDDDFSRDAPRSVVRQLLDATPHVRDAGDAFVYEDGRCCVEIDFGAEGLDSPDRVSWIGLRVPAGAKLDSATRAT
jgi:hypothetical protein